MAEYDIFELLEKRGRHWDGITFNDQLAGRNATPMLTIEMTQQEWDAIKRTHPEVRAVKEMYEALWKIRDEGTRCMELCQQDKPVRELYNIDEVDRIARQALASAKEEQ